MINKIKKVTRSDWAPTIKNTVYDIAKFSVFFYVCGLMAKEWVLKLNDDTTKIFLSLHSKFKRN